MKGLCDEFWINDINEPLVRLMEECVNNPLKLVETYENIWGGQFCEGENNIDYFTKLGKNLIMEQKILPGCFFTS